MLRKSKNGSLYFFNFRNLSVTVKNGTIIKSIFVGERIHESREVFTVEDFCRLYLRLEEA